MCFLKIYRFLGSCRSHICSAWVTIFLTLGQIGVLAQTLYNKWRTIENITHSSTRTKLCDDRRWPTKCTRRALQDWHHCICITHWIGNDTQAHNSFECHNKLSDTIIPICHCSHSVFSTPRLLQADQSYLQPNIYLHLELRAFVSDRASYHWPFWSTVNWSPVALAVVLTCIVAILTLPLDSCHV